MGSPRPFLPDAPPPLKDPFGSEEPASYALPAVPPAPPRLRSAPPPAAADPADPFRLPVVTEEAAWLAQRRSAANAPLTPLRWRLGGANDSVSDQLDQVADTAATAPRAPVRRSALLLRPGVEPAPSPADPSQTDSAVARWEGQEPTRRITRPALPPPAEAWLGAEGTLLEANPRGDLATAPAEPNLAVHQATEAGVATPHTWLGSERTVVPEPGSSADGDEPTPDKPATRAYRREDAAWAAGPAFVADEDGTGPTLPGIPLDAVRVRRRPRAPTPTPATSAGPDPAAGPRTPTPPGAGDDWHHSGRRGKATGQIWGDYEIGGIIGEGGMGTVYRAVQKSLGRRCAVKVLAPHLAEKAHLRERFELEARSAGLMRSSHVVAVYAAGNIDGQPYYVMEYVEGTDLEVLIRQRRADGMPWSSDEACDLMRQAALGLTEAGSHNLVHRDIKPPNLMVTTAGELKITDFGIVKVRGESNLTMTGQAIGTPAYISPEQGRGEEVDGRADLYSLGVVFYELLTGQRPFLGATSDALIYQHSFEEPRLPRELNPAIPEAVQAIVIRLLAKKPENRYQSAAELSRDLEDLREGKKLERLLALKLSTGGAEALREQQSWVQRHLLSSTVSVALAAVLTLGLILWWFGREQELSQRRSETEALLRDLRQNLGAIDAVQDLDDNLRTQLRQFQEILAREPELARTTDAESLGRWTARERRIGELRSLLTAGMPVDDETGWDHAGLHTADSLLTELRSLVGEAPADVAAWTQRIKDQHERIAAAQSDYDALLAQPLGAQSLAGLETACARVDVLLSRLLPAEDRRLAAQRAGLAARREEAAALESRLTQTATQDDAARDAAGLRAAAGDLALAARVLPAEHAGLAGWRAALGPPLAQLAKAEAALAEVQAGEAFPRLDQADLDRIAAGISLLTQRRAAGSGVLEQATRRIAEARRLWTEVGRLKDLLRPALADGSIAYPVAGETRVALDQLRERLDSRADADADVVRWQDLLKEVDTLHATLADLPELALPDDLDRRCLDLLRLRQHAGADNDQVRRWARRLEELYGPVVNGARPTWAAAVGSDRHGVWALLDLGNGVQQRFRCIPAAIQQLGSPEHETGRDKDEGQIELRVPGFWLADTECSQALWLAVMERNPSRRTSFRQDLSRPVDTVDIDDCLHFLTQLAGRVPGLKPRLPSEHEWERACRAGEPGPWSLLRQGAEDEDDVSVAGWSVLDAGGRSRAVAGKRPNALGLYDMHGNVWEWCGNRYGPYAELANQGFPALRGEVHVIRGGSWGDPTAVLRSANRCAVPPEQVSAYLGLRIAIELEWPSPPDGQNLLTRGVRPRWPAGLEAGAGEPVETTEPAPVLP